MYRLLVLLVLLVPVASAGLSTPIEWSQHIYSATTISEWDGDTISFTPERPHDFEVVNTSTSLLVSASVSVDAGTGAPQAKEFQIFLNNTLLSFCRVHILADGSSTVGLQGTGSIFGGNRCPTTSGPGVELFNVTGVNNFTFDNTGSAGTSFLEINVYLLVQDEIVMNDLTINTALDAWLPFVILFALIAVSAWRGWNLVIYPAVVGMILFLWDPPLMPLEWIWGVVIVFFAWHALREILRVRRRGREIILD